MATVSIVYEGAVPGQGAQTRKIIFYMEQGGRKMSVDVNLTAEQLLAWNAGKELIVTGDVIGFGSDE